MYPFVRLALKMNQARRAPRLGLFGTHVSHHICWPWDLDLWWELNNGRTLTIYDLGRIPMAERAGLLDLLKRKGWGLTIAGSAVRYRRRVRMLDRIEIRSHVLGWDRRFLYVEQSMWRTDGQCSSQAVFRAALTDGTGIVTTDRIATALGISHQSPALPDWVQAWSDAEDMRPWPPMRQD